MPDDERIEEIFASALRRKAEAAPSDHGLAARVRARLARRRRRQVAGATVACVAIVAGFVGFGQLGGGIGNGDGDVAPEPSSEPAPDGWRWESYGGVEVQVPDTWGYGTTGTPPCLDYWDDTPYVGRPGVVPSIACPDPLPDLGRRVPYLWFDSYEPTGVRDYDAGWISETRTIHSMKVTVLADDAQLRSRILDSARVVDGVDGNGCPVEHPITQRPGAEPPPVSAGLGTVGDIESISVCRYSLVGPAVYPVHVPLLSSSRLAGPTARDLVRDLLAAPEGSGPNQPRNCLASSWYGSEAILLRVRGTVHDQEVYVRYDGCERHGTDDGVVQRRLTAPVLQALLTGPHRPDDLGGPVADLAGWR